MAQLGGVIPALPDPGNAAYTMAAASAAIQGAPASRTWLPCPVKNQSGQSCVPTSWRAWMESAPVADKPSMAPDIPTMYAMMQGQGPGIPADPAVGCQVADAARVMVQLGRLGTYVWGTSAAEIRDFICSVGGVTFACIWFTSMSSPGPDGLITVTPSSGVQFSHQVFLYGYDAPTDQFLGQNSWGTGWGLRGRFRIQAADIDVLFKSWATCCSGAELPNPDAQPSPTPDPAPAPPKAESWFVRLLRFLFGRKG